MKSIESRNRRTLLFAAFIVANMSVLVVYSPTLYRMFCDLTGFGGTVRRAAAPAPGGTGSSETITVNFDANVDPKLPWEFRPEQRSVRTNSDETVVARATFNVTPFKTAPYFFKIECFCFTEERLGPGESALMPLVLYVDEQLLKDESTQEVRTITLSYTFYKQENLSADEVEAARDLKAGSREIDTKLDKADTVEFDNDAPRR